MTGQGKCKDCAHYSRIRPVDGLIRGMGTCQKLPPVEPPWNYAPSKARPMAIYPIVWATGTCGEFAEAGS